jgi:homospermidine synthase
MMLAYVDALQNTADRIGSQVGLSLTVELAPDQGSTGVQIVASGGEVVVYGSTAVVSAALAFARKLLELSGKYAGDDPF